MFVAGTWSGGRGRVSGGLEECRLKDIRFVVGVCRAVLSGYLSGEGAMVNPIR